MTQETGTPGIASLVREEVERTIQRSRRGVDFVLDRSEPQVGTTPRDLLMERGTLRLYRYRPTTDEVYRVPLVLVMSLVSKPYILDLSPGQSMVESLLREGFDVFMIDWGEPGQEDRGLRLESYVLEFLPRCLERVQETTREQEYTLVGYCMGGLFCLMYGGLFPEAPLRNLVCIATPVNFEGMGLFRRWCDPRWFDVDRIVDTMGNVPPELVFRSFELLRPHQRLFSYARLWDNLWSDDYVRYHRIFDKWMSDQVPIAGEAFRQLTKDLMWENKLLKGELRLGGQLVETERIACPVFHAMAEHDHIAPYEATAPLSSLVGSEDKDDMVLKGGHVSLVAGKNAVLRLFPSLSAWLGERSA